MSLIQIQERRKKLTDSIERIGREFDESDMTDVLVLVEHMHDKENAILWITCCITALITKSKIMRKSYRYARKRLFMHSLISSKIYTHTQTDTINLQLCYV